MDADQILVPYSFSGDKGFVLCSVECVEICDDKSWQTNGETQKITNKLIAFKQYFEEKSGNKSGRDIAIIPLEKSNGEAELTETTDSVFLGIFLKAAQEILQRKIKKDWDFVIATGDIKPTDDDLEPEVVMHIKEKFNDSVKSLAQNYPDKKILFVCVHNEEKHPFEPDYPKNITVKVFTKDNTFGEILATVFEPKFNEEQRRLLLYSGREPKHSEYDDYISTETFENLKKEARLTNWNGCFIHGQGESGKTRMAFELVHWLMENEFVYAPIWVNINNKELQKSIASRSMPNININKKIIRYNSPLTAYFANLVVECLEIPDTDWQLEENLKILREALAKEKRHYILVIDNLECPYIEEILKSLKIIVLPCLPKIPVIVTSRIEKRGIYKDELELASILQPKLTEEGVEKLVINTAKRNRQEDKITEKKGSREYHDFIQEINYNYSSFPGIIEMIIPLLDNNNMADLRPILVSFNGMSIGQDGIEEKIARIFENILLDMDEYTQAVLFSFLGYERDVNEKNKNEISLNSIFQNIKDSGVILHDHKGNILTEFWIKDNIEKTLIDLKKRHLIIKANESSGKQNYYFKSLTYNTLMFNSKLKGKLVSIKKSKIKYYMRDCLVSPFAYVLDGILFKQPADIIIPMIEKLNKTKYKTKKEKVLKFHCLLYEALIISSDILIIQKLVKYIKNINLPDEKSFFETPLHIAAFYNNSDIIEILLKKGAKINIKDRYGYIPLHHAAWNDKHEIITLLLNKDKSLINEQDNMGNTPLHIAIIENNNSMFAEKLLKMGAKYDIKNYLGNTVVHILLLKENIDINLFNMIVNKNKKTLFYEDNVAITPLHLYIMKTQNLNIITWLKENNIDINDTYSSQKKSLLHYAALNKNEMMLKTLLEAGARYDVTDLDGATVMHYAAYNPCLHLMKEDIITILEKKGLSINAVEKNGDTPLHCAAVGNDSPDSVILLLDKGAKKDINKKNNDGMTPLHYAAHSNENPEILDILLKNGANKDMYEEVNSATPLMIAARYNANANVIVKLIKEGGGAHLKVPDKYTLMHFIAVNPKLHLMKEDIITILINEGLDLNAANIEGETPLHYAATLNDNSESVAFLLSKYRNEEIDIKDNYGVTPLNRAADNENPGVAIAFIKAGASLKIKDDDGKTPLYYLKKHKDWKLIKQAIKEANR